VDSDGTIVGDVIQPPNATVPPNLPVTQGIVWRADGTSDLIPFPPGLVDGVNGLEVRSIRNGVITAAATITSKTGKQLFPVTYDLSTGRFTLLPGANIFVSRGNANGDIAGQTGSAAAIYTPATGVVPLPMLRKASATHQVGSQATTISDSGRIIGGQDLDDNYVIQAVMWTCH